MDSMSASELAKMKFDGIKVAKPYGDLLGEIALTGVGFVWGESYSGKSTLALGIANAMADFGRVDFIPAEEKFSITITKKINRLKAYNTDLHFTKYKSLEKLKKHLSNVGTKVVFIDSVSVLDANDSEVVKFSDWCKENGIGMWMIAHANKDGTYKGNSKMFHEADICIEVLAEDNIAHSRKNRFDDTPRSIQVPFEVKAKGKKKSKSNSKKKSKKKNKAEKDSEFDSQMSEVEDLLKSA